MIWGLKHYSSINSFLIDSERTHFSTLKHMNLLIFFPTPKLHHSLQPSRSNPTTSLPIPLHARNSLLPLAPGLKFLIHLTRLPIPETHKTPRISTSQELAVGRNIHVNSIPANVMSAEALLSVLSETIGGCIYDDLVVARIESYGFSGGVGSSGDEGKHVGFCDEFDGDVQVEFPCSKRFVVRGSDEASVLVDESDGIYGAKMVVIFLCHFARASIVLHNSFVRHANQEFMRRRGVEFNDVWDGADLEAGGMAVPCALTRFGVPQFDTAVV